MSRRRAVLQNPAFGAVLNDNNGALDTGFSEVIMLFSHWKEQRMDFGS